MEEAVAYHHAKLVAMFNRCRERNVKLNKENVEFKRTEVPYIGHLLTTELVKADPTTIEPI